MWSRQSLILYSLLVYNDILNDTLFKVPWVSLHAEFTVYSQRLTVSFHCRFNITTSLQLVNRFLLMPGSLSAAKFAQDGELFARMKLEDDLSVDSVAGRLILRSTNLVWLAPHKPGAKPQLLPLKVRLQCVIDYQPYFFHIWHYLKLWKFSS